jgi:hypothetical protein
MWCYRSSWWIWLCPVFCPLPQNVNKTACLQTVHGCSIFPIFPPNVIVLISWWEQDFDLQNRFHHILGQRNRCTIWFWVWHPGFGSSSSPHFIKVQIIKSEDVRDKRGSFRSHKILFRIILNHSILNFTFPFSCWKEGLTNPQEMNIFWLLQTGSTSSVMAFESLLRYGACVILWNAFISSCSGLLML